MKANQTISAVPTATMDGPEMAAVVLIAIILVFIAVFLTVYIMEQRKAYKKASDKKKQTQPAEKVEESSNKEIEVSKEDLDEFRERIEKFCKNVVRKREMESVSFYQIQERMNAKPVKLFKEKNNNRKLLPYEDRIVLLDDVPYISASYVCPRGQPDQRDPTSFKYIAAQGPIQATIIDFWAMTLRKSSKLVVMLCQFYEGKSQKCAKYFPEVENDEIFEKDDNRTVKIKCTGCQTFNGIFIVRKLGVTLSGENGEQPESSTVTHIQFLKWPNKGIPETGDFLKLFIKYLELKAEKKNLYPNVIHCSAGISRTGAFITFEVLVSQLVLSKEENQPTSLMATIEKLRKDRMFLVYNEEQYRFIYDALIRLKSEDRMMNRIVYFYHKRQQMETDLKAKIGAGNKSEFVLTEFTLKWSEPAMSGLTLI